MKLLVSILLCVSTSAIAWTPVLGYPEALYQMTGKLIESSGSFKNNVELVYAPSKEVYGLSFFNRSRADQAVLPSGEYQLRACQQYADGVISGPNMLMTNDNAATFTNILSNCDQAIFIRVYDEVGNFATYRFDNTHSRTFKEIQ
ncbi:hypothetical protein YenMTG1_116 [Yersinia phage vB_YenM_TG1]|uniref:Uncharacterized protein n=1 Tax=Yersinia phage vB_YenM_TG1 TaxID=1589265 RepID=A0A0B5A4G3_9CAUD|nr:hypothetical protein AVV33_gp116 [Yersinia phage vB_YenM_TG1]AJD81926.1 hypothetical protein YenMTG1_116 [Yersinia phage vB_YenM_TG1]